MWETVQDFLIRIRKAVPSSYLLPWETVQDFLIRIRKAVPSSYLLPWETVQDLIRIRKAVPNSNLLPCEKRCKTSSSGWVSKVVGSSNLIPCEVAGYIVDTCYHVRNSTTFKCNFKRIRKAQQKMIWCRGVYFFRSENYCKTDKWYLRHCVYWWIDVLQFV